MKFPYYNLSTKLTKKQSLFEDLFSSCEWAMTMAVNTILVTKQETVIGTASVCRTG